MGKQKYFGKTKNTPEDKKTKPYTKEELDEKIARAEKLILNLERRIRRLTPFIQSAQEKLDSYVSAKQSLEEELKQYTGILAQIKYALRAMLQKEENEAKVQIARISGDLDDLQAKIDNENHTIELVEKSIAENRVQIQGYEDEANRWRKKRNERFPENETGSKQDDPDLTGSQPGE